MYKNLVHNPGSWIEHNTAKVWDLAHYWSGYFKK